MKVIINMITEGGRGATPYGLANHTAVVYVQHLRMAQTYTYVKNGLARINQQHQSRCPHYTWAI